MSLCVVCMWGIYSLYAQWNLFRLVSSENAWLQGKLVCVLERRYILFLWQEFLQRKMTLTYRLLALVWQTPKCFVKICATFRNSKEILVNLYNPTKGYCIYCFVNTCFSYGDLVVCFNKIQFGKRVFVQLHRFIGR